MINNIIVVVTRNPGGVYASYDEGATFTQVAINALTTEVHDISINEVNPFITVYTMGMGKQQLHITLQILVLHILLVKIHLVKK